MNTFSVTLPNGQVIDGVPEGTTKEQLRARLQAKGIDIGEQSQQPQTAPQQGYLEGLANAGGEVIANRGIGLLQSAQDIGVPVNKAFGISPEQFKEASQRAVAANTKAAEGTGVSGAIIGMAADPLNLAPLGRLGKFALPAYGAISGATGGQAEDENRLGNAVTDAGLAYAGGKALELGGRALRPALSKAAEYVPQGAKDAVGNTANYVVQKLQGSSFGKMAENTVKNATPKSEIPEVQAVRENASKLFQEATDRGAIVNEGFNPKWQKAIDEVTPKPLPNGNYTDTDKQILSIIDTYKPRGDENWNLDDLQKVNSSLGDAYMKTIDPRSGQVDATGKAIAELQSKFANIIDNLSDKEVVGGRGGLDALKIAKVEWQRQAALSEIARAEEFAKMYPNESTALTNYYRALAKSPSRMKVFEKLNPESAFLIRKAAKTGLAEDTLRTMGSRLISTLIGGAGGDIGGAAAGYAAGALSRKGAAEFAYGKSRKIAESVLSAKGGIKTIMDLPPREAEQVFKAAKAAGVSPEELIASGRLLPAPTLEVSPGGFAATSAERDVLGRSPYRRPTENLQKVGSMTPEEANAALQAYLNKNKPNLQTPEGRLAQENIIKRLSKDQSGAVPESVTLRSLDKLLSRKDMLNRGADGHLTSAYERYIPISKLDGLEPTPSNNLTSSGEYIKGTAIKQPIEVIYDANSDKYIVYGGNHRIAQAKANGQSHIIAFVEPDKSSGRPFIGKDAIKNNPDNPSITGSVKINPALAAGGLAGALKLYDNKKDKK